jgi:hypothetical protein
MFGTVPTQEELDSMTTDELLFWTFGNQSQRDTLSRYVSNQLKPLQQKIQALENITEQVEFKQRINKAQKEIDKLPFQALQDRIEKLESVYPHTDRRKIDDPNFHMVRADRRCNCKDK